MALGRSLFIFANHFLFLVARTLFNVEPENAYLIFKYAVVAQAPIAVVACWILARDYQWLTLYGHYRGAVDCVLAGVCAVRRSGNDRRAFRSRARDGADHSHAWRAAEEVLAGVAGRGFAGPGRQSA